MSRTDQLPAQRGGDRDPVFHRFLLPYNIFVFDIQKDPELFRLHRSEGIDHQASRLRAGLPVYVLHGIPGRVIPDGPERKGILYIGAAALTFSENRITQPDQ